MTPSTLIRFFNLLDPMVLLPVGTGWPDEPVPVGLGFGFGLPVPVGNGFTIGPVPVDLIGERVGVPPVPVMVCFFDTLFEVAVTVGTETEDLVVVPPTGPRPGMLSGKHFENKGKLRREISFLVKVGALPLPSVASTLRSTSMAKTEVSWTPVFEAPAVLSQRPVASYAAVSVAETCGSLITMATSKVPTPVSSTPNANFGCEKAAAVTEAVRAVTSKLGVILPPSKPEAVELPGFWTSAVICAVSGTEAARP